jgi:hypothetical protein
MQAAMQLAVAPSSRTAAAASAAAIATMCRYLVALLTAAPLLVAIVPEAFAADPVFPTGSRLGLVPPPAMVVSRMFQGFQDPATNATILLTVLPAAAYAQLDKTMVPELMKKQGIDVERREPIEVPAGKGFILSGREAIDKEHFRKWLMITAAGDVTALVNFQVPENDTTYSEQAVRGVLATLAVRASVPEAEQLSLVPFKIDQLAGFHVEEVVPGRAIVLVDLPPDQKPDDPKAMARARMMIAALPGGPEESGDRDNFARVAFSQIIGIKDVVVQDAGPLRITNQAGYQTLAKAKDTSTDADVMVVQWLRFGSGGFLRMVGIGQLDAWPDVFGRLRSVRDSVGVD